MSFHNSCLNIFIILYTMMDSHWPDLIQRLNGGAETTMDTEDLAVNDGREGEVVEDLCAVPPHLVHKVNFWQLGLL